MKIFLPLLLCLIINSGLLAQLRKDIDGDGIKDFVYLDSLNYKIVCELSSKKFKPIYSKENLTDELNSGIRETKSGFEFFVNYMRAGFANQFRYDSKTKKIQLIGMSRYEFGPANNDGSGNSSVNLLTNNYIGEWNIYDSQKEKLIKIPTIKTKMYFTKQYLDGYNGEHQSKYEKTCSELFYTFKRKYKTTNNTH